MTTQKSKIAVITGACNIIGKIITDKCCSLGINVALIDDNIQLLNELKMELSNKYSNIDIEIFSCDLSNFESQKNIIKTFKIKFNSINSIDYLFNNIGMYRNIKTILDTNNVAQLKQCINMNLLSMIYTTKIFMPYLKAVDNDSLNNKRYIINTSCITGLGTSNSFYSLSKQCIIGFSEALHNELKSYNSENSHKNQINVSVFLPKIFNEKKHSIGDVIFNGIKNNYFWIHTHYNLGKGIAIDKFYQILTQKSNEYEAINSIYHQYKMNPKL